MFITLPPRLLLTSPPAASLAIFFSPSRTYSTPMAPPLSIRICHKEQTPDVSCSVSLLSYVHSVLLLRGGVVNRRGAERWDELSIPANTGLSSLGCVNTLRFALATTTGKNVTSRARPPSLAAVTLWQKQHTSKRQQVLHAAHLGDLGAGLNVQVLAPHGFLEVGGGCRTALASLLCNLVQGHIAPSKASINNSTRTNGMTHKVSLQLFGKHALDKSQRRRLVERESRRCAAMHSCTREQKQRASPPHSHRRESKSEQRRGCACRAPGSGRSPLESATSR